MGKSTTLYAGLDVRNDSVDIATCTAARCSQGHTLGILGNVPAKG